MSSLSSPSRAGFFKKKFSHLRVYITPAGIGYRPMAPQSFNPALNPSGDSRCSVWLPAGCKMITCLCRSWRNRLARTGDSNIRKREKARLFTQIADARCSKTDNRVWAYFRVNRSECTVSIIRVATNTRILRKLIFCVCSSTRNLLC